MAKTTSLERRQQVDALMIDAMLDVYNDYMALYKNFGDEEYLSIANGVMTLMQNQARSRKRRVKAKARIKDGA